MDFPFNLPSWRRKSSTGLAHVLIAMADPVARRAMRQMVARNISAKIIEVEGKSAFHHAVTFQEIDLIIADVEMNGCQSVDIIELIRYGRLHRHAFPVVIMLVDQLKDTDSQRVTDCGADLVVAAEGALRLMPDTLEKLRNSRRPFVVTPHYTGPERRNPDRAVEGNCLTVPNPLAARLSSMNEEEYRRQLSVASHAISLMRRSFYLVPESPPVPEPMAVNARL